MIWEGLKTFFLEDLMGSHLAVSMLFLLLVWFILLLIRATKEVFVAVTSLYVYFLVLPAILPAWVFFILLIAAGVFLGKAIIDLLFGGN